MHFPEANRTRVVLNNLSIHTPAALHTALPAEEARRNLRRVEFHYTPRHAIRLHVLPFPSATASETVIQRCRGHG